MGVKVRDEERDKMTETLQEIINRIKKSAPEGVTKKQIESAARAILAGKCEYCHKPLEDDKEKRDGLCSDCDEDMFEDNHNPHGYRDYET